MGNIDKRKVVIPLDTNDLFCDEICNWEIQVHNH